MSEVLEQDEIDSLLNAISESCNGDKVKMPNNEIRRIKIYDFKRPDKFTKEQIREMSLLFESVCRTMTTYFSAKLRGLCHFKVASVDQLTYEEFIRSIPTPTTICDALWAGEKVSLEIDPSITREFLYVMYEGKAARMEQDLNESDFTQEQQDEIMTMLGGIFHYSRINIDLTDIEQFMMKTIAVRPMFRFITSAFNAAYRRNVFGSERQSDIPQKNILPKPSHIRMENNPQFVQSASPTEMVVLVTIESKIGDEDGMINVCLPYPFVKNNMIDKNILNKESVTHNEYGLIAEPGNAVVSLGQFHINDGKTLAIRDLIPLDTLAGEPVDLIDLERNEIFAKGEVVVIDENLAVRITEVLNPPQNADADYIAGEFGPTIKSGNAYARLGQFTIREDSKFEEGTVVELDTIAGMPTDLVRKCETKPFARGEIVVIDERFGLRVTELCNS